MVKDGGRLCETHTLQVPLAYWRLSLATGGATGSVQQLCFASSTTVPSARMVFEGGGEDLGLHVSWKTLRRGFVDITRLEENLESLLTSSPGWEYAKNQA